MEKTCTAILILLCLTAFGQDGFPGRLEDLGEYRRAAVEYLRLAHEDSTTEGSSKASFKAALCFEKTRDYSTSKKIYLELDNPVNSVNIREAAYYRAGVSDFFLGKLNLVVDRADNAEGSDSLIDALTYLSGWSYFFGREYAISKSVFEGLEPSLYNSSAGFMFTQSDDGLNLKRRSPFLAASMSVVLPGSGKAYYGRWGDALVNFIVIGCSAGGATALWEKDRDFALTLAVIGAFFYGGNVYGSYVGAKWFNEQQHRELYRYARQNVNRRPEELFDD